MIAKIKLRLRISSEVRSTKIADGGGRNYFSHLKMKKPITNGCQTVYNVEEGNGLLYITMLH